MDMLLEILKTYGSQISIFGVAIAFIFGVYKFISERRTAHYWKEFEVYHKLVKELVGPEKENDKMYLDRQAAIVFELRNFKRYYPFSLRMLKGLKENGALFQINILVCSRNSTLQLNILKGRFDKSEQKGS